MGVFVVKQTIRIYYTLIGQLFSSSYQNFSVLTLSVIADAMPPLPKGEASALPDSASANREDALAPPLGELAKPKALTERVSNFHTKSPRHLATAGAKLQI